MKTKRCFLVLTAVSLGGCSAMKPQAQNMATKNNTLNALMDLDESEALAAGMFLDDMMDAQMDATDASTDPEDGSVSADLQEKRAVHMAGRLMDRLDSNHDGALSLEEFLAWPKTRAPFGKDKEDMPIKEVPESAQSKLIGKMTDHFQSFADPSTSLLSEEGLVQLLKAQGPLVGRFRHRHKHEHAFDHGMRMERGKKKLLEKFDANGDGKLDDSEKEATKAAFFKYPRRSHGPGHREGEDSSRKARRGGEGRREDEHSRKKEHKRHPSPGVESTSVEAAKDEAVMPETHMPDTGTIPPAASLPAPGGESAGFEILKDGAVIPETNIPDTGTLEP